MYQFVKKYRIDIICVIFLFIFACLPRLISLGTFLTADEKTWMGRSFEFVRAFQDLRFNDMLQTTHPGVTTLWVSGLAIMAKSVASHTPFADTNLIYFIKTSQFSIALLNALAIPFIYLLLYKLLRRREIAIFGSLIIALDPFLIGYSRVVHVDALMGSLLTLAVLSSMVYAKYLSRPWLIASAVFGILAILTKFPAVFILPFIIVALIVYNIGRIKEAKFIRSVFRDAAEWTLLAIVLTCIIWPALLFVPNPEGNVLQLKRDIADAAVTPHDSNEDYNLQSLNILHYPHALLDRSMPLVLIGSCLGIVGIIWSLYKKKLNLEMLLIAIYLFGFVLMMTIGAKKGDRYIVPAFFALDILAAYGIYSVIPDLLRPAKLLSVVGIRNLRRGSRLGGRDDNETGNHRLGSIVVASLSTIYLLYIVISYHPYALAYSSPLFPENLSQELGWGEGLDQVAAWLNTNSPHAVVASWYPEELGAFTSARVLHINAHTQNPVQYIVLYKNMFGRAPEHYANDFIDEYFKKQIPIHTVYVAGKQYAWIYAKPSYVNTVGELDSQTIAIQEIDVKNNGLAGIQILPATRFGESNTGVLHIEIAHGLADTPIYEKSIDIASLKDSAWAQITFPESLAISKGERLFIRIFASGSVNPYASLKYSREAFRTTPIYISRTGNAADAVQKPGSLAVQLLYLGTDGKVVTELEEKLLQ